MAHDALARGTSLKGKYRIEERLGAGGMAVVYRATNITVDRTVALKVLNPQLAKNKEAVARFKREALAANQARHPNIVDVLDVDQDGDLLFIVQEYLEGEDMGARIKRGRMSPREVLAILTPVAEAVGAAHAKGVIHRDLKPENIYLVSDGTNITPKVLDFGISKMPLADLRTTGPAGGPVVMKGGRITVAGVAMGTPYYMSPEQIRDPSSVDVRTDVWAIGVMLYEALSGTMPFDAEDMGDLFAKIHTMDPQRLDKIVAGISPAVAKVVHRCMRVERDRRYGTATELARALRRAQDDIDDEPSPMGNIPEAPSRDEAPPASRAVGRRGEASRDEAPPSVHSGPGAFDLELDLPPSMSRPRASSKGAASERSAEREVGSQDSDHLEQALEIEPARASDEASADGAGFRFDEDDDEDFGPMDLAVAVPGSSGSAAPRIAIVRERSPESRRRIHMRQHAGQKLTASYLRFVLAGALIACIALGSSYLTPLGMASARGALGGWSLPAYAVSTGLAFIALVVTGHHGLRLVSYSLFLASLGLTVTTLALVSAMLTMFAPGLAPSYLVTTALFAGPYATMATVVGYGLFALAHGRVLRRHDDERVLGSLLMVASLLAVGACVWIVQRPVPTLLTLQSMRPALVEPLQDETRELAIELRGGQLPPTAASLPLRSTDRSGAVVDHVSVPLRADKP